MSTDMKAIVDAPAEHGFQWTLSPLEKNGVQVVMQAPHIQVLDVTKFTVTFGADRVLQWLNGTALRVETQRVVRDACAGNINIRGKLDELKLMVVQTMFGVKATRVTVVTVQKFVANDETEWNTKAECIQYNKLLAEAEARIEAGN